MATWTKETVALSIAGASLTVDDIKIDGTTIGHTDDTNLLTLTDGNLAIDGAVTGITTLATSGNVTVGGDLTISGGNITSALTCDGTLTSTGVFTASSTASIAGLLTATSGVKLGNNYIYASDGGIAITTDTDSNVTIAGDLTVNGGDIIVNNMTSSGYIKCVGTQDNSAAIELWTDEGDDPADKWQIEASTDGKLNMMSGASGMWATTLSLNSNSTTTDSSVTVAGDLYVGGDKINLTTTTSYGVSSYSVNRTITGGTSAADTTDVLATLIKDLIDIGIIDAA